MFIIQKQFGFEAAHKLEGLPWDHPCSRPHGHSYAAIFTLKSTTLNDVGFVRDYRDLDRIKRFIDDKLDHRDLNQVLAFNPTAELIAKFLYESFADIPELTAVTVKETEKTTATYEPYLVRHKEPVFTR